MTNQEGYVLAAQNAGSLLMLLTGMFADRLNGKLMVCLSLILVIIGNGMLPLMAPSSFWLVPFSLSLSFIAFHLSLPYSSFFNHSSFL